MKQTSPAITRAVPPRITPAPLTAKVVVVITCVSVLAASAILYFFNPSTHGFYPVCEFHELTGLNCPGCGGTRAAYQLLHGHLMQSLHDNALFLLSLAALSVRGGWIVVQRLRRRPAPVLLTPILLWLFLAVAIAFTVLRNLPLFSFLSP